MKKHGSGFGGTTPEAYFNQFFEPGQTTLHHQQLWLDNIWQCIWNCIQFENEMNTDALYWHCMLGTGLVETKPIATHCSHNPL